MTAEVSGLPAYKDSDSSLLRQHLPHREAFEAEPPAGRADDNARGDRPLPAG